MDQDSKALLLVAVCGVAAVMVLLSEVMQTIQKWIGLRQE